MKELGIFDPHQGSDTKEVNSFNRFCAVNFGDEVAIMTGSICGKEYTKNICIGLNY